MADGAVKVTKEGIRAFLDRPWSEVERAKERDAAQAHAKDGATHERLARSMWTVLHDLGYSADPDLCAEDLAGHIRLREILDRAARGRAR